MIERLGAERVILTHIEEMDGLSHDDFQRLRQDLRRQGCNVEVAYDTLLIEV
jgi:phosphoribosyl 1,2-cyclic phosphate phosphodiesterase